MRQYTITLTERQLIKIIDMAKKGTLCSADNDLIQFLEYKLNLSDNQAIVEPLFGDGTTPPTEIDLDEIPF